MITLGHRDRSWIEMALRTSSPVRFQLDCVLNLQGTSAPRELESCDMHKLTLLFRLQVPFKATTWDVSSQTFHPSCTPSEYKERSRRVTAAALSQLGLEMRLERNHTRSRIVHVCAALAAFIVAVAVCCHVIAFRVQQGNNGQPQLPVELPQVGPPPHQALGTEL